MEPSQRIERALEAAVARAVAEPAPPLLAEAVRHAVFGGGARVRPRLCLTVALACGDECPELADAAAVAIELMHCASLVHDDLPCFDDAATRRGQPSVHVAYGERLAVLAGDALIVHALETLTLQITAAPERAAELLLTVSRATGMPYGITAGQAWESEPEVPVAAYHQAKTGSLFAAATVAGAIAAGDHSQLERWRLVGERLGEAYQVADDLRDAVGAEEELGKPTGQDVTHGLPSAVRELGVKGAKERLDRLVEEAVAAVPDCAGAEQLRAGILKEMERVLPKQLGRSAA
ncbi:geranylgeranyl pyrophosphate synthase [Halorhodospira abdelmalekii]|uniref:polyprenyl synthetase family protein n=1 Tax=Halorhodospira abdelmalekii TaxID=421629 RepID=UPI00190354C8|nr:polyprenyl synthetase family protein [Halorhodospira abdelmalekii]MBK1735210.1 geranylgeranyl pyrophosphate synthase [Halorhodospira abdelmalekii]